MISNLQILNSALIRHSLFEGRREIYLSNGNQLFGSYSALTRFAMGTAGTLGKGPI
jgi:hypothetical protein